MSRSWRSLAPVFVFLIGTGLLLVPTPALSRDASPDDFGHTLGLALKGALFLPSARTGAGSVSVAAPAADRAVGGAGAFEISYAPPFLKNALSLRAAGGISPLGAEGTASLPADPDFGTFTYAWSQLLVPLTLGVHYDRPLGSLLDASPLGLAVGAGGAAVFTRSTTTYEKDGVAIENATQTSTALGWYLGLEATWSLGPGVLLAEYRFVSARTDLGLPEIYGDHLNPQAGEVQGSFAYLGYRLLLSF